MRDPHAIPRNLYLIGGKCKQAHIDNEPEGVYVARNQRLKRENIITYKTATYRPETYSIVEFPHRFIDFSDFLREVRQTYFDILTADLKVDDWYFERYQEWKERINETYASLQQ